MDWHNATRLYWVIVAGTVTAYMINSVILALMETYIHVQEEVCTEWCT